MNRQSEEVAGPIHVQTQVPVVEKERKQVKIKGHKRFLSKDKAKKEGAP